MDLKALLAQLKAAGVKVEALSEDALALVAAVAGAIVKPVQEKLTAAEAVLAAASEKGTELEGKVTELATAAAAAAESKETKSGKSGSGKPAKDDGEGSEMPGWFKVFAERFDKLEANVSGKDKADGASRLLDGVLKKSFPNLKLTERQRERFLKAGHAKPEDLEADIRAELADLKAMGVKVDANTASPEGEGAEKTDSGGEALTKDQRIERGRKANRDAPTSAKI